MKDISLSIINKLQSNGFQAYWVGGCVRDILMGKTPKDYDIVTSAKPDEIEKLLSEYNILSVGKQFGIIIVVIDGHQFEIATFRSESSYSDSRHPDKVFWTSASKDAERRDFTINGLFLDPLTSVKIDDWKLEGIRQMKSTEYGLVIDYVGGIKDLEEKIIRFIGNAEDRINEDNLRMLRAIRFKNILGFGYTEETIKAIKNNSKKINSVSSERIRDELDKMMSHKSRYDALMDLDKFGLLKVILPELEKLKGVPQPNIFHQEGDVFTHSVLSVKSLPADAPLTLVWAVLLHDSGKPDTIMMPKTKNDRIRFNKHVKYSAGIASKIARRLKFANFERELIVWLVKNHMIIGDIPRMAIAKQRKWLMDRRFPWLLELTKADSLGTEPVRLDLYEKDLKLYNEAKKLHDEEMKKPKFKPFITGSDLILKLGLDESPVIGKLLEQIEDAQLEGKIRNKKEALEYARKLIEQNNASRQVPDNVI
jgi:poly(A) polymerase